MSSRQHASPAAAPDPRAALLDIEAFLAGSLAAALMATTDEIDREQTFNALGVDSIVGVEWVRAINDRYGTALPATVIYDHPSVRAMARHVSSNATPGVAGVARGDASAPQAAPSAFAAAASSASGRFRRRPSRPPRRLSRLRRPRARTARLTQPARRASTRSARISSTASRRPFTSSPPRSASTSRSPSSGSIRSWASSGSPR
ncbi:acyl carrier protein [Burkholderia thailandensis]|uniref:acyl carrier protein n=1 Tax=Burkholderia thailandensis TaxID=57975 RepID=UPI001D030CF8|nr:acyl carrier protein [Burkholderia thailandensis]